MGVLRILAAPLLGLCLGFLQGCTSWQINELSSALPSAGPEVTLKKLEEIDPSDRDRAQYLLNRGTLKFYSGDLDGSRQDLEQAKAIMFSLDALSVSENFAALTTNETLRSYAGTPSEQVLVHAMLAQGYLFSGNLDGARVEMLQADVTMKRLGDGDSLTGQLASVRFLAGLIYEINGELDNAMISYRKAYQIVKARGSSIPDALATSLLNLSLRQNNDEEYGKYSSEFGRKAVLPKADEGEWIMYYHDGVVSNKKEARLSVFEPKLKTLISVVMPDYPPSRYYPRHLSIKLQNTNQQMRTEVIELIEARAREDLADNNAKAMAAATLRAVAKFQMVKEAQKSGGDLGGLLANIAGVLSEQADVRSWNMLPSSIQVARLVAPLNAQLQIPGKNVELPALNEIGAAPKKTRRYGVASANSLNNQVLSYPPQKRPEPVEGQPNEQ